MSREQEPLSDFSVQRNADIWFQFDPANMQESRAEHQMHLAALYAIDADHPDITEMVTRLQDKSDPLLARMLVRSTVEVAYDKYALAVDLLTGLKTQEEYERWLTSTYGKPQDGEQRAPHRKKQSFTCLRGDLNNFKKINDRLGEDIGDEVLQASGEEIMGNLRVGDHIIAVRNHRGGDETLIAAAGFTPEQARGFWKRLYTSQLDKVRRQQQIWRSIEDALAERPEDEPASISARNEVTRVEGEDIVLKRRILEVNDRAICEIRELAIIDLGYSFGEPDSLEDIAAISERADRHKQKTKDATRTRIEAYR
jgi:diguanylate cyclase (GGDEF)-like protein